MQEDETSDEDWIGDPKAVVLVTVLGMLMGVALASPIEGMTPFLEGFVSTAGTFILVSSAVVGACTLLFSIVQRRMDAENVTREEDPRLEFGMRVLFFLLIEGGTLLLIPTGVRFDSLLGDLLFWFGILAAACILIAEIRGLLHGNVEIARN